MSGGFFRGTSADQDTRFSNKQAKLLKSQKFAPELDHLVDMTKVKMDVIKPWIAHRVTEILGFEDEVLINFIYGLLDVKDVNGKEVQIQITGFMEKSTGKFMKELWGLLLSAQSNASGVPQQFLDAKEEEIRKKKAETDRIAGEIQKKKEIEQEKKKKMDEEVDIMKALDGAPNPAYKHSKEDKGFDDRNGFRGKNRSPRSSHSREHSPSPPRIPRSRSISKSFSNSRSYSDDRHRSRSISRSLSKGRSISPDRSYRSPRNQSLSPRRRYSPRRPRSPIRRRSPHSRHRSSSYARRRSPSPRRRRSPSPVLHRSPFPRRRRSPSPRWRRSPSPWRRRSPSPVLRRSPSLRKHRSPSLRKRRSPTPVRRDSPTSVRRVSPSLVRRRSPSPLRRRSPPPMRRRSRSPVRRRSPSPVRQRSPIGIRRRSPSPSRYRSPSPPRRRTPSPPRRRTPSPVMRRSPRSPRRKRRSGSPHRSRSPAYRRRRSSSRDRDIRTNGVGSRRYRDDYVSERIHGRKSPLQSPEREDVEHTGRGHKGQAPVSQPPISLRSPQRDPRERGDTHRKRAAYRDISPSKSGSSLQTGMSSPSEDKRTSSLSEGLMRENAIRADSASPIRQTRHLSVLHDNEEPRSSRGVGGQRIAPQRRRIEHSPKASDLRNYPTKNLHQEDSSPLRLAVKAEHHPDDMVVRKKNPDTKSEKAPSGIDHSHSPKDSPHRMEVVERGPGFVEVGNSHDEELPSNIQKISPSPKVLQKSYSKDHEVDEKKKSRSLIGSESDKYKSKVSDRRKHKRQDRHVTSDDETSYDSDLDDRKEAKRRKKEERRLRKEEKRRRREERHRRREQRRAEKLKAKNMDVVARPLDAEEKPFDADDSDDYVAAKIDSHPSDTEETESEQKKLEIELRKKALESLRAKKAINI